MKAIVLLLISFISLNASAYSNLKGQANYFQQLFANPSSNTKISQSDYNRGETRPKALLKGVFYFGGSDVKRSLLSSGYRNQLCEDGFDAVYSVYKSVNKTIKCSNNKIPYSFIGEAKYPSKKGDNVYKLLKRIYNIIQMNGAGGAIYLHCHYGVHASNTIAQMVLMQFCDISKDQAYSNWDKVDLYNSLGAKGRKRQMQKMSSFEPYPEFEISSAQKATVCY